MDFNKPGIKTKVIYYVVVEALLISRSAILVCQVTSNHVILNPLSELIDFSELTFFSWDFKRTKYLKENAKPKLYKTMFS